MKMWPFKNDNSNKNPLNSDEYGDCLKRIVKISTEHELLKAVVEAQSLKLDNLRGNFSRKLKGIKEDEEKEKTETINNGEFLPFG